MEFAYATDENTYAWSNAAGRGHQQQRSTGARKSRGGSSAHGLSPAPPNPFGLSPIASVSGMAALLDDVSIDGMGAGNLLVTHSGSIATSTWLGGWGWG